MKKTLALLLLLAGLSVEAQGRTLTWDGSDSIHDWSYQNWLDQNHEHVTFHYGDDVRFLDFGSRMVTLSFECAPRSVDVKSNLDYTFDGDGKLTGDIELTKRGKGKLTIETANDFEGITAIVEGTLVLGNDSALGNSSVIMNRSSATLDLGTHTLANEIMVSESNATISNGTLAGQLTLFGGTFTWSDDSLILAGEVELDGNASLDLGKHTLSNSVIVSEPNNAIGNGTIEGDLFVTANNSLALLENTTITGGVNLGDNASLDLGKNAVTANTLTFNGNSATIGNGTIEGDLSVGDGKTLNLCGDLGGSGTISMSGSATLNLGTHTLSKNVTLNGTSTIKAEHTTIKALDNEHPGLLKDLTVSDGLIAGTDKQSSLADGLEISRMGYDLTLENLILTANNKISVGNGHTITLNNVTIKISADVCTLVNGIYTIDLHNLINCDLVMENVLLDASDLTLPEGFDPANTSVVFDFGDDVTIKQATGMDMRLGKYWSPSIPLDEQGKIIFTKLVDTPEPTTGTLGLLALAALAARRRKK